MLYADLLEILADASHPEHAEVRRWAGARFDPEAFDAERVRLADPKKRWRRAFG